jgi:hypothetical protein
MIYASLDIQVETKFNYIHLGSNVMQFWDKLATQVNIHIVEGHLAATIGTISSEILSHPVQVKSDSVKNQKYYYVMSDFRFQLQCK